MKHRERLVSRTLLVVILALFSSACQASGSKGLDPGGPSGFAEEVLVDAIEQTHFSAVVRHVTTEREEHGAAATEQVFLHRVEVREVLRGPEVENLTYRLYAEPGETSATPSEWVIITLCEGEEGLEWPGTSAIFPATVELVDLARKTAQDADPDQQTFNQCEW